MALAIAPDVIKSQPGLLGDASRPGLQALPRLVIDAEAALQSGRLQQAKACLDTYFGEVSRLHGVSAKTAPVDQFVCRAHFARGQLVAKLSSSCKGQQLVDAVLEAVDSIMRGVDIAAANPRYSHLVYNGSVHYWHVVRPLQCDKLRQHLLPSQERLCLALEKVEGQAAWRVRHLLSLALCQAEAEGKPEDVQKTLAKALELATAANLPTLRAEVLALQTHQQTAQAAKVAAAKPGAAAAGAKGAAAPAAPAPPAAPPKQAAPAGKKKPGEAPAAAGKPDIDGALAVVQWVLSAKPDAAVAEQQLQAALKMVDTKPDKPGSDAQLLVVGRIGWAAAASGVTQLAQQCSRRAATSQALRPRVWADLIRLLLSLQSAPEAALGPGNDSSGSGGALAPAALKARREVVEGTDEVASAFLKLGDVEGIHNCAVLAWNAGLPLLQPCHRSLVKPAFTAVAKALEAVGSPWTKLRAALHREVAKSEADADSFIKAAKEVSTALSLNYPSSADMAAICGYERPLDRLLEPMARAAQLRGVAQVQLGAGADSFGETAARPDDDVVLLLERGKDSKSAALRAEYLQKAVNKLALLPTVLPPSGRAGTDALQQQLRAARSRTQLWADIIELAWRPFQLDVLVRSAVPFVLEPDWAPVGDREMLVLQARMALVGADAAKAALARMDAELALPPGYTPSLHGGTSSNKQDSTGHATSTGGINSHASSGGTRSGNKPQQDESAVEGLQRLVADYTLRSMQLAVAAGGSAWLVMNAAMSAWNTYLPLMQRERYAGLASLLLPLAQALLQEPAALQPDQLIMLAEAAAKAAEHVALLRVLQQQQQPKQQQQQPADGSKEAHDGTAVSASCYQPLSEARGATAGLDVPALLAGAADALQLLSDTAACCQIVLTRAATAAEPQGLIQAYARLQQLQGKPVVVPPGAPAAMADTSKLLGLIEGLTAAAPGAGSPAASTAAPAPPASAGRAGSAASGAAAGKAAAGGKGAAAVPVMSKVEQDIHTAISLLSAMPTVNLQLWAQLSRAAGWHGHWLLARECASAALGALPAGKRDLAAVTAAADLPEVSSQGWYWLAVAEMQQGQAVLSLMSTWPGTDTAASLSLCHSALQHLATAARLAGFIRRADLAEAAARLAYNASTAPGGLLETALTRAAALPLLSVAAAALNATKPADISFQVKFNLLLLECMSSAGRWQEARRHVDALHRSLPLSKQKGPAASKALEALAGWRATCLVKAAAPGKAVQDMPRLLSELSTPQAKARAWQAFAQASTSAEEQLLARQSALTALDGLAPEAKVDYQLEFATWLASSSNHSAAGPTGEWPSAEQLLMDAAAALEDATSSSTGGNRRTGSRNGDMGLSSTADTAASAGSRAAVRRRSTAEVAVWDKASPVYGSRKLVQVHLLLSQVAAHVDDRQEHLLQALACSEQLLTWSLLTAGAEPPPEPVIAASDLHNSDSATLQSSAELPLAPITGSEAVVGTATAAAGATSQQAAAKGVVPPLVVPARPATAASAAASTGRSLATSEATSRGIIAAQQLPGSELAWAFWRPTDELLTSMKALAAAADAACSQGPAASTNDSKQAAERPPGSAGASKEPRSAARSGTGSTLAAGRPSGLSAAVAGPDGVVLSRLSMQAPELLLANLQVLSEQLQAAGRHAAALPVMQLARCVALVTLDSKVAATVAALQLSTLCDQLGLSAAAADWQHLAAPESWPSAKQQQQAARSQAVQLLARDLLQGHAAGSVGRPATAGSCEQPSQPPPPPQQQQQQQKLQGETPGFLVEVLAGVDKHTLASWLPNTSSSGPDGSTLDRAASHGTWGSRVGSAQGGPRPSSAAGAGAAAAALAAGVGGSGTGSIRILQVSPVNALDGWVCIARYLVDHAQYTAGQKLCSFALEQARSCGDSKSEAEVLLQQARLALLAQHYDGTVKLSQAAQAIGGSVQLWRDSVLCYAAARDRMPGRGPADALEALEGGVALLATAARGYAPCFKPTVLAASAQLKLELSRTLTARAELQLEEAQEDPSCLKIASQLHAKAVSMAKSAAADAQQAGAVLQHAEALQAAAALLTDRRFSMQGADSSRQPPGHSKRQSDGRRESCGRPGSSASASTAAAALIPSPGSQAATLEALDLLQDAYSALEALPTGSSLVSEPAERSSLNVPENCQTLQLPQQAAAPVDDAAAITAAQAAGTPGIPEASHPAVRALASVVLQLSQAELLLAKLQLQAGDRGKAATEPEFPRVEGRNPQAVIAYLSAVANAAQGTTDARVDYMDRAVQHAQQASVAATASNQPGLHAAAVLVLGQANMLQAHAVMLEEQQGSSAAQQQSPSSKNGAISSDISSFDAAWLPWVCPQAISTLADPTAGMAAQADQQGAAQSSGEAVAPADGALGVPVATGDSRPASASGSALPAGEGNAAPGADSVAQGDFGCGGVPPSPRKVQLPSAAEKPYQQAIHHLQLALQEALQHQQLSTAEAAARSLMYCYGWLSPEQAAMCAAVAQSCSSSAAMRSAFQQAAALQHPEVLLWRQLEQLEAVYGAGSVQQLQVQQLLSLLGITNKRLQVPQPASLVPVLAQLQPHQRLLLLHHDKDKQQLVVAAWGMPGSGTPQGTHPAAGGSAAAAHTAPATAATAGPASSSGRGHSSSGGGQTARGRKSAAGTLNPAEDAAAVAAAAAAAAAADAAETPPAALLGSMPCTAQQLQELIAAFAAYSRQLQKAVVQAVSTAVPIPAADPAAAAAGSAVGAAGAKKPAAGAGAKAGGKDKGAKDAGAEVPSWVPPGPVFPAELNEQWQQLMQKFEQLLQPVASLLADALHQPASLAEPPAAPAPAKQGGKTSSTSGGKAAAAAAAAGVQPAAVSLQLLLDLDLVELPWEALSEIRRTCGSVGRCFSLAQLRDLLLLPQAGGVQQGPDAPAALDLARLSYLVDPLHHMSAVTERPGCYAAPLIPCFRQQLSDLWGQEWQGFTGCESQTPSAEQVLKPLVGSKGLLVLAPGRLLGHVGVQAVAGLDMRSCTAALLFDKLDNAAAAAHQTKADNRKTATERALEGPSQTALLLMLRGVRAVALAALPGTPHAHVHLASNVLRGLSGTSMQALQLPSSGGTLSATATGAGGAGAAELAAAATGPLSLGEAVAAAQRHGMNAYELQAVREAGMVVYGLASVAADTGGSGGSRVAKQAQRKGP